MSSPPGMSTIQRSLATVSLAEAGRDAVHEPVTTTHYLNSSTDSKGRRMVNQYIRLKTIGQGSHGKVWLCAEPVAAYFDNHAQFSSMSATAYIDEVLSDPANFTYCAIKSVARETHRQRRSLRRRAHAEPITSDDKVRREVAIMKRLDHPNIVKLKEIIDDVRSKKVFMVLEFMGGGQITWQDNNKNPTMTLDEARRTFRDVLLGLDYLHYQGIIHRDIKPANLLWSDDRTVVKISDFGVSHLSDALRGVDDEAALRKTAGSPAFFAPELCNPVDIPGADADASYLAASHVSGEISPGTIPPSDSHIPSSSYIPSAGHGGTAHTTLRGMDATPTLGNPFSLGSPDPPASLSLDFSSGPLGLDFSSESLGQFGDAVSPGTTPGLTTPSHGTHTSTLLTPTALTSPTSPSSLTVLSSEGLEPSHTLTQDYPKPVHFISHPLPASSGRMPLIGPAIDVWALGVTLYCLLFGDTPFMASTEYELYNVIVRSAVPIPAFMSSDHVWSGYGPPPPGMAPGAGAPGREAVDLLSRLLDKDPAKRITLTQVKRHPFVLRGLQGPALERWFHRTTSEPVTVARDDVTQDELDHATQGRQTNRLLSPPTTPNVLGSIQEGVYYEDTETPVAPAAPARASTGLKKALSAAVRRFPVFSRMRPGPEAGPSTTDVSRSNSVSTQKSNASLSTSTTLSSLSDPSRQPSVSKSGRVSRAASRAASGAASTAASGNNSRATSFSSGPGVPSASIGLTTCPSTSLGHPASPATPTPPTRSPPLRLAAPQLPISVPVSPAATSTTDFNLLTQHRSLSFSGHERDPASPSRRKLSNVLSNMFGKKPSASTPPTPVLTSSSLGADPARFADLGIAASSPAIRSAVDLPHHSLQSSQQSSQQPSPQLSRQPSRQPSPLPLRPHAPAPHRQPSRLSEYDPSDFESSSGDESILDELATEVPLAHYTAAGPVSPAFGTVPLTSPVPIHAELAGSSPLARRPSPLAPAPQPHTPAPAAAPAPASTGHDDSSGDEAVIMTTRRRRPTVSMSRNPSVKRGVPSSAVSTAPPSPFRDAEESS